MRENRSEYTANVSIRPVPSPLVKKAKTRKSNTILYGVCAGLVLFVLFNFI